MASIVFTRGPAPTIVKIAPTISLEDEFKGMAIIGDGKAIASISDAKAIVPDGKTVSPVPESKKEEVPPPKPKLKLKILQEIDESWGPDKVAEVDPPSGWEAVFKDAKPELATLTEILLAEEKKGGYKSFPMRKDLYRAFHLTPLDNVKVVIIGQDPYPQQLSNGQPRAVGLSFSVRPTDVVPSSLTNIYKEIKNCYPEFKVPNHGDLTKWAQQGVLLLNMSLTVPPNLPDGHKKIWWGFLSKVFGAINTKRPNTIFLLWGKNAQGVQGMLGDKAVTLTAAHPSGQSAHKGFFFCQHFSIVNKELAKRGETPIDWQV